VRRSLIIPLVIAIPSLPLGIISAETPIILKPKCLFTASVTDGKPLNADNVSNALPLAISTPLLLKP
jgi:hypothetical protein